MSAPTSLAVHTARRANLTLAGFVRGTRVNVYAPERPALPSPDARTSADPARSLEP